MTDLKPCPMCKSTNVDDFRHNKFEDTNWTKYVGCNECYCEAPIEAWQTRATDWQTIETAPSDELVWIYSPDFSAPSNTIFTAIKWRDEGFWRTQRGPVDKVGGKYRNAPTHWMPQPSPPEGAE